MMGLGCCILYSVRSVRRPEMGGERRESPGRSIVGQGRERDGSG